MFTLGIACAIGLSMLSPLNAFDFIREISTYVSLLLTQAGIILSAVIYCAGARIDFAKAIRIKEPFNLKKGAAALGTGLSMMFTFLIPLLAFMELLKFFGYQGMTTDISIVTVWDLILGTVFVAALPAVCEEVLFRGVILQGLRRFGDRFAIIVSSVFFMLMHGNPDQTIYPLMSGIVMGYVFVKTGDLKYSMIIHFVNNFLSIVTDFIYNNISAEALPAETLFLGLTEIDLILVGVGVVIFVICLIYFIRQKSVSFSEPQPLVFKSGSLFVPPAPVQEGEEQVSPVKYLFDLGFKYNFKKDVFVLAGGSEQQIEPPPGFLNVSDDPAYNPTFTRKSTSFLYALPGILICAGLWVIMFFMGLDWLPSDPNDIPLVIGLLKKLIRIKCLR